MSIILALLSLLIAGFLGYAASRPDIFHVQRTIIIRAPADKIFLLINDFHGWASWSPYEALVPAMERHYGGAARGEGAVYGWRSKGRAGSGRMEIMDTAPPWRVAINLDLVKPFKTRNSVAFDLSPGGNGVNVTWSIDGYQPPLMKIMGIFKHYDRMIGTDFENGLARLKALVEA